MPRANRHFLPGYVWHITHRCHQKEFLLKFACDRKRWLHWLFEAKKRYGLSVLNYMVTSNHIHLLVHDQGKGEIAQSMQLIAGRTAQEYNLRKGRKGAYWEDRYHATAVDTQGYLARCLAYIDMNMVRAGVVTHPAQWRESGYRELMAPPQRYAITNVPELMELLQFSTVEQLQQVRSQWVDIALNAQRQPREGIWSESLAAGNEAFVADVHAQLGIPARHRTITPVDEIYALREPPVTYDVGLAQQSMPLS
jgi:putative transposase